MHNTVSSAGIKFSRASKRIAQLREIPHDKTLVGFFCYFFRGNVNLLFFILAP